MSDATPPVPSSDRNLLFGILALQMDFISRDALIQAMNAWVLQKHKPLGQVLQEQGALGASERDLLEALVQKHLQRHGDNPRRSLASVATPSPLPPILARIVEDDDLQASLSVFHTTDTAPDTAPAAPGGTPDGARYQVLRPHAKGGLGQVFVALDRELQREVALKEIHEERAHDAQSRGRFLLEAEITGRLEHPGVVPVYGLGQHPDGRPFYAMRLIKGETLLEAIRRFHEAEGPQRDPGQRRLALRQLLGQFVAVCNTVAYAHSRGVLHRDLKPSNMMLGKYGETLVIDWGLAKAVGRPDSATTVEETSLRPSSGSGPETAAGAAVGTPAYMSPEQAAGKGDLVGPASDIYSLGVTLYTLLAGRSPFHGLEMAAVLDRARRGDWQPPRQVNPRTPAALDAVCRKAMAHDPKDRYATALDLAADVEHWLADEPVTAWREPRAARLGRWVRRHRTGVAGAVTALAVAAVCLGAATGLLLAAYQEANQQRQAADEQRDRAAARFRMARDAVDRYHTRVSESADLKAHGLETLRQSLLQSAADFYQMLVAEEAEDVDVRAEQGRTYRRLAVLSADLGDTERARQNGAKALAVFDRLIAEHPGEPQYRADRVEVISSQGLVNQLAGRLGPAAEKWEQALAECRELVASHPGKLEYQRHLSTMLGNLGSLYYMKGDPKRAKEFYEQDLTVSRELARAQPENLKYQQDLGDSYSNLGLAYTALARPADAEQAFDRALALQRPLYQAHPRNPDYQLALARSENNLGNLLSSTARPRRAIKAFESAKELQRLLVEQHPLVLEYQRDLALTGNNLGDSYTDVGRPDRALADYQEAQKRCRRLLEVQPDSLEFGAVLGGSQAGQALALAEMGKLAEALEGYTQAVGRLEAILKKESSQAWAKQYLADTHLVRALCLARLGRQAEADQDLQASVKLVPSAEESKYRVVHAQVLARAGTHGPAAAEADAAARDKTLVGRALYWLASAYAVSAEAARKDTKLPEAERKKLADLRAGRAVAALERARTAGYFESAAQVERLRQDPDFAALRPCPDYRKLLAAVEGAKPPGNSYLPAGSP
jgi:serine/threonine-protein kinase